MIASLDKKILFIHIPKNAGNSIRCAIKDCLSKEEIVEGWGFRDSFDVAHPMPAVLKKHFPKVFQNTFDEHVKSVAILRDPITRAPSAYKQHRRQYKNHPQVCKSFNEYLDRIEENCLKDDFSIDQTMIHGMPQHRFILDSLTGKRLVKTLIQLEDPEMLHKLSSALNLNISSLGMKNRSVNSHVLTRQHIKRILKIYDRDFKICENL